MEHESSHRCRIPTENPEDTPKGGTDLSWCLCILYLLAQRASSRMEQIFVAPATAHTRCALVFSGLKAGTRLKHAPPALRTGAGRSRARLQKQVPLRDRAAAGTTPNSLLSECCAARTHPPRSALPLRTSRRPFPCFTPSLSVCFCSQSLRVPGSQVSRPSKKSTSCRRAPPARCSPPPARRACSAQAPLGCRHACCGIFGTRSG